MEARCRLCFGLRSDMSRIFPDNDDEDDVDCESQLAIKVLKCTSLQLPVDDDDLTSQICKECITKLDEFFQFRVQCRKNNILYRKRKLPEQVQTPDVKENQHIGLENDQISLENLDETLLKALEGKDISMDAINFDHTFGSEVKPEDLLKIDIGFNDEQKTTPEEVVSSSSARCNGCGEEFSSPFDLNQHMGFCPSRLKNDTLQPFIPNIGGITQLTCHICNRSFNDTQELKYHESLHSNSPSKCNFCHLTFPCSRTLKIHMDQHKMISTLPDGRFKCDLCDATFKLYGNLIIHRRSHTGERPYPCYICGRAFSTSSNMKTHMNVVHSQDRPFKCHQCHKSFNTDTRLRSHMETHSFPLISGSSDAGGGSELSSTCKICNKTFSHPSYLTIHYRVHTGERPYQCRFCTSAFATSGNLKVHMRIHAAQKVRPYKCNMCTKSFLHASNLSVHKKTQHY
ncbi:zinc finger protein 391-like [Toxorhynchites rutilus septentrionalis]|uniref:zinc finger protein 391-like n=1 Tax=Toxorhynchites rutilus septentrionalis TaxID=329112 RepID=UPI00247B04D0|nr:zinc finger protein 391-like [Toxorhynchites rutilus septentrionalis]XP_055638107.1 zinc finger protein 391-like [Toxorhynchites rutilus septentrionalis]XP_055638108.1 zinc finger protein 391-like [Toxorhynchites rutilus septentrionalis]